MQDENSPDFSTISPLITPLLLKLSDELKLEIKSNFDFVEVIGKGSYGIVTKIKKKTNNIEYALKTIYLDNNNNEKLQDSLKEIGILSRCNHPNIINLYGYEIKNYEVSYVMDLMESNLETYLKNKNLTDSRFVLDLYYSLLDALYYLFINFNIMHRDIKPQNILLNGSKEIKLADFGTVKGYKGILKSKIVGSLYYIAPELSKAMNESKKFEVTANFSKCDVFSLGMTILRVIADEDFINQKATLNINEKNLQDFIVKNKQKIPYEIYDSLIMMLTFNEDLRPDIISLYKITFYRKELNYSRINSNYFNSSYKINIEGFNLEAKKKKEKKSQDQILLFEDEIDSGNFEKTLNNIPKEVKFRRNNTVPKLNLENNDLNEFTTFKDFKDYLRGNSLFIFSQITALKINLENDSNFITQDTATLGFGLKRFDNLKQIELDFRNRNLNDSELINVLKGLKNHIKFIENFKLIIPKNSNETEKLNDLSFLYLVEIISSSLKLKDLYLDFRGNKIEDDSIFHLIKFFTLLPRLENIYLNFERRSAVHQKEVIVKTMNTYINSFLKGKNMKLIL